MSEKEEKSRRKGYVRAAYAPDGPKAALMLHVLEENGIDAFRKGGVRDIYQVKGEIFGEEIMVAPENLIRAQELLKITSGAAPIAPPKSPSVRKTILCLLAAFILLMILLFLRGRFLT